MAKFKSKAQEAFMNSPENRKRIGDSVVEAWNKDSKGLTLPEHVPATKKKKGKK